MLLQIGFTFLLVLILYWIFMIIYTGINEYGEHLFISKEQHVIGQTLKLFWALFFLFICLHIILNG